MRTFLLTVACLVAFPGMSVIALAGDGDPPQKKSEEFKIKPRRDDDRITARVDKDRVLFDVKSPFGISCAVIERTGEKWPGAVVLRLHLKGLESFRASNGKVALHAAVSGQQGKPMVRLWKDGKEDAPLDQTSPFWMDLRMIGGDGKPAGQIPLQGGYFEVPLPKAFFQGNPKSITLNWIDFYRQ